MRAKHMNSTAAKKKMIYKRQKQKMLDKLERRYCYIGLILFFILMLIKLLSDSTALFVVGFLLIAGYIILTKVILWRKAKEIGIEHKKRDDYDYSFVGMNSLLVLKAITIAEPIFNDARANCIALVYGSDSHSDTDI